ncbi:MAG: WD40/YVTN/BNR-like repeat-containing protein [Hyphomicrobium sp.]
MSDTLLVATRKGLFTFTRRPAWTLSGTDFLGDNVSMVLADRRNGRRYAALEHGHFGCKMHRSQGEGAAWEECASPTYPAKPEGVVDTDGWGKPIPWSTVKIWALETGGPDERGVLWSGTIPGGLFRSTDGAASWELVRPLWDDPKRQKWFGGGADLPGIHSISVDPRDPRMVRAGVSCGGVWRTTNGGGSWECHGHGMFATFMPPEQKFDPNIQDVHRLAQCASSPDRLWVQHHNGIFRSDDGGAAWHEVTDVPMSNFGFVVAVHPRDPDTAWFVPGMSDEKRVPVDGRLVVTRTRDGGKSFEVLSRGLPEGKAFDIVYRHGLDVDDSGDRLAFGSTTGGLWVSDDQGDTWACLSQRLPPIHAVRFA